MACLWPCSGHGYLLDYLFTVYGFGGGASKRPCVFEVFGVGWGGVGCDNVHISCVQGDARWMRRCCYVDHTVMLRRGAVEATVGVGWGGVGCDNVHVSCVQGDARWMLR